MNVRLGTISTILCLFLLASCASNRVIEKEVFVGTQEYADLSNVVSTNFTIKYIAENEFQLFAEKKFPILKADFYRTDKVKRGGINGTAIVLGVMSFGIFNAGVCAIAASENEEERGRAGSGWDGCRLFGLGETEEGSDIALRNKTETGKTETRVFPVKFSTLSFNLEGSLIDNLTTDEFGKFSFRSDDFGISRNQTVYVEGIYEAEKFRIVLPQKY